MNLNKILVVEDDPSISELIKITLASPSYNIACVDSGDGAVTILKGDKPDLVVLDILIPGPDGWAVYKFIRNNPRLKQTRVIILTALPIKPDALADKNILSTDLYMTKPFELEDLRISVKSMIAGEKSGAYTSRDSDAATGANIDPTKTNYFITNRFT
jgi:two-component system alkaline phosphatase synthesis response regulator PhoP